MTEPKQIELQVQELEKDTKSVKLKQLIIPSSKLKKEAKIVLNKLWV